jgi:hypothetical protein
VSHAPADHEHSQCCYARVKGTSWPAGESQTVGDPLTPKFPSRADGQISYRPLRRTRRRSPAAGARERGWGEGSLGAALDYPLAGMPRWRAAVTSASAA